MRRKMGIVFTIISIVVLGNNSLYAKKTLYQEILNALKIQYVFSIPSLSYGPGAVYYYTEKSGYLGVCLPWNVINCTEAEYQTKLKPYPIPSWQQGASRETTISFSTEELGKIGAEYKKIRSIELELSGGKLCMVQSHLADLAKNATTGKNKEDIDAIKRMKPGGKTYLALNCYQYDVKCVAKDERGIDIGAAIPESVLKIILPKIGITIKKNDELMMSADQAYIGFNGGNLDYYAISNDPEPRVTKSLEWGYKEPYTFRSLLEKPTISMIDITELTGKETGEKQ
jgi:hypothetical protein